jgi:hypothetical protein
VTFKINGIGGKRRRKRKNKIVNVWKEQRAERAK